jgi:hypothetical protein
MHKTPCNESTDGRKSLLSYLIDIVGDSSISYAWQEARLKAGSVIGKHRLRKALLHFVLSEGAT